MIRVGKMVGLMGFLLLVAGCVDFDGLRGPNPWNGQSPVVSNDTNSNLSDADIWIPDGVDELDLPAVDVEEFSVVEVAPNSGSIYGGDLVMLVGGGFVSDMEVFFGENKAAKLFVVDSHYLTVESPPHAPGVVDVKIVTGQDSAVIPDAFTYVAKLTIETISPATGSGAGNLPVEIRGTGFEPSCRLFLGGRPATQLLPSDSYTLFAVTPPGGCGPVDVVLRCGTDQAALTDGFDYLSPPTVDSMSPNLGPVTGNTLVRLKGTGFTPDMRLTLGGVEVPQWTFIAPEWVEFRTPAQDSDGVATLTLETPCGDLVKGEAFLYVDPQASTSGPPRIVGLIPSTFPACNGGTATLVVAGGFTFDWYQILMDSSPLEVVGSNEDDGILQLKIPPHEPGMADLQVIGNSGVDLLAGGLIFEDAIHIESVTPGSGYLGGGTLVTIEGCGFPSSGEVRLGGSVAGDPVFQNGKKVRCVTPPGSPGPVDVSVVGAGRVGVAPGAYTYMEDKPTIYFLEPDTGSQAGGTWIRVHGSGLPEDGSLRFGGEDAFDVHFVHSGLVTLRAPAHEEGVVDVVLDGPHEDVTLPSGYTYFDPRTNRGGTWGGPLDESLNVTVLDASNGHGVLSALVIVGGDETTKLKGYTDGNGQITFSQPGFYGKQSITAAAPGYSFYSVIHFDARNVTVILSPKVTSSGGTSGTYVPPKAWVTGRVYGMDKYVVVPPGECSWIPQVTAPFCQFCEEDSDCAAAEGEGEFVCAPLGTQGTFCTRSCLVDTDCPASMVCANTGMGQVQCIPRAPQSRVRCESSKSSLFGYPPDPGDGGIVNKHHIYFINSKLGNAAVVCYGGWVHPMTGVFDPTVMGVARGAIVLKDKVVEGHDVTLDIPLSKRGKIAFYDLPQYPQGLRQPYLLSSIELGKEGYLAMPKNPVWNSQDGYFLAERLPEAMSGPLEGATYSLYASVQAQSNNGMPYAVRMVTEVETLSGDGMLVMDSDVSRRWFPPMKGDIVGVARRDDGTVIVVSNLGEGFTTTYGTGWTPLPLATGEEGFSMLFQEKNGGLWLGGTQGTVWYFSGVGWTRLETGFSSKVLDIWGHDGEAVLLFSKAMARVSTTQLLETTVLPDGYAGRGLWGSDFEDLWIITSPSALWRYSAQGFSLKASYSYMDFTGIDGSGPDDIWLSASPATALQYDGALFTIYELDETLGANAITAPAPGVAVVAGDDGRAWRIVGDQWEALDTGSLQDYQALWADNQGRLLLAGIQAYNMGPFMAYPRIIQPSGGSLFDFKTLKWDYWTPGAQSDFNYILFSDETGYPFWTLVTDGPVTEVKLPPISQILGLDLIPLGPKRINLTASLNPLFKIDNFSNSDFSMYKKTSWAVDFLLFDQ